MKRDADEQEHGPRETKRSRLQPELVSSREAETMCLDREKYVLNSDRPVGRGMYGGVWLATAQDSGKHIVAIKKQIVVDQLDVKQLGRVSVKEINTMLSGSVMSDDPSELLVTMRKQMGSSATAELDSFLREIDRAKRASSGGFGPRVYDAFFCLAAVDRGSQRLNGILVMEAFDETLADYVETQLTALDNDEATVKDVAARLETTYALFEPRYLAMENAFHHNDMHKGNILLRMDEKKRHTPTALVISDFGDTRPALATVMAPRLAWLDLFKMRALECLPERAYNRSILATVAPDMDWNVSPAMTARATQFLRSDVQFDSLHLSGGPWAGLLEDEKYDGPSAVGEWQAWIALFQNRGLTPISSLTTTTTSSSSSSSSSSSAAAVSLTAGTIVWEAGRFSKPTLDITGELLAQLDGFGVPSVVVREIDAAHTAVRAGFSLPISRAIVMALGHEHGKHMYALVYYMCMQRCWPMARFVREFPKATDDVLHRVAHLSQGIATAWGTGFALQPWDVFVVADDDGKIEDVKLGGGWPEVARRPLRSATQSKTAAVLESERVVGELRKALASTTKPKSTGAKHATMHASPLSSPGTRISLTAPDGAVKIERVGRHLSWHVAPDTRDKATVHRILERIERLLMKSSA